MRMVFVNFVAIKEIIYTYKIKIIVRYNVVQMGVVSLSRI